MIRATILIAAAAIGSALAAAASAQNPASVAQGEVAGSPLHGLSSEPEGQQQSAAQFTGAQALFKTPVTGIFPGGVSTRPDIKNPVGKDPAAAQRGMAYFNAFNCVGCHAANGAGGMGRALTDRNDFLYGASPANIYLTITQGRPNGMPAWGALLPDPVIWDLVAYIEQINQAPDEQWGTTVAPGSPAIEQAPAEFTTTANPWAHTEPFSNGQNPAHAGK
ncbi:MAG TPA: cytochrome c [Stellaceae bacterium]|jgi:cytochrome c oxidase cbb3-type subunit 3|nr:cytochrome c [Stellaceae bacterium]